MDEKTLTKKRIICVALCLAIVGVAYLLIALSKMPFYDYLAIIAFVFVPGIAVTIAILIAGDYAYENFKAYRDREISWMKLHYVYLIVYYWLVGVALLAPAIIAIMVTYSIQHEIAIDAYRVVLFCVISIFAATVNFIVRPDKHAYSYRLAFEQLQNVIFATIGQMETTTDNDGEAVPMLGKKEKKALLDAVRTGEVYIRHSILGTFDTDSED